MTDNRLKRAFRIRLQKLVKDSNRSWDCLAKDIGIPYGSLQGLLIRKKYLPNPKMITIIRIAEYFDVEINWLLLGCDNEN